MIAKGWTPAFRRYQYRVIASSLAYAALLLGAVWLFKHRPPQGVLSYLVAVAPAIPLVGVIASMGLFLREEDDEFKRAAMVEQILWGTAATLAIATVWGFLESFGLAPHMDAYWGACVWFAMFGLARGIVAWRYR
jgi:drug/metabolite transporter (DMT)-like permease